MSETEQNVTFYQRRPISLWVCRQAPLRMGQAISAAARCSLRARDCPSAAEKNAESRAPRSVPAAHGLGIDQLQFVAASQHLFASALGLTQIQSMPGGGNMVPLVSIADLETALMQRVDQRAIQLQQGLAAGADDIGLAAAASRAIAPPPRAPGAASANLPPPGPVGADKIGVAEFADRVARGPFPARSTDCSRQSAGTRRRGRYARPRLAACSRFP